MSTLSHATFPYPHSSQYAHASHAVSHTSNQVNLHATPMHQFRLHVVGCGRRVAISCRPVRDPCKPHAHSTHSRQYPSGASRRLSRRYLGLPVHRGTAEDGRQPGMCASERREHVVRERRPGRPHTCTHARYEDRFGQRPCANKCLIACRARVALMIIKTPEPHHARQGNQAAELSYGPPEIIRAIQLWRRNALSLCSLQRVPHFWTRYQPQPWVESPHYSRGSRSSQRTTSMKQLRRIAGGIGMCILWRMTSGRMACMRT
jgi:hypothetical protein